ncbi:MAG: PQQ-like beta-propeller repeat protein [Thermoguttaceae bacterium]|nr:PQQ-like beta-propeller repeat protein [Thermoguttaceae bacterium]
MMLSAIKCFKKSVFFLFLAVLAAGLFGTSAVSAQGVWKGHIIPQDVANSRGLERQWIAHTEFNPFNNVAEKIAGMVFDRDAVFTVTEQGTAQAFEAETGKTKWVTCTKTKGKIVQGLAVSRFYLAFTAGSTLYVLNRENGRILLDADVPAIPTNDLALGEFRAYVPAINGLIYIFNLQPMEDPFQEFGVSDSMMSEKERQERKMEFINSLRLVKSLKEPLSVRSIGDLKVTPVTLRCNDAYEYVAWPTGSKLVTLCEVDVREELADERYNIPTMGEVVSSLSYKPYDPAKPNTTGILYAATTEGFVYAFREATGDVLWRFPTGEYIGDTPIYVDGELFVTTALTGMFCIDALVGGDGQSAEAKWWSPNIKKFIACTKHRVYVLDDTRALVALDRISGQRVNSLPMVDYKFIVTNTQNDRIYFATEDGTIQCLREMALGTPLDYSAEWIAARESSVQEMRRAHRKDVPAKPKKNADRMGDDEDGGWGEEEEEEDSEDSGDDDGGFSFGDDDEEESGDEDEEDFGDEESEDEEDLGEEDFGDEEDAGDDDDDFGDEQDAGDDDEDFGDEEDAGDDDDDFGDEI